jgi:hypothetical protein
MTDGVVVVVVVEAIVVDVVVGVVDVVVEAGVVVVAEPAVTDVVVVVASVDVVVEPAATDVVVVGASVVVVEFVVVVTALDVVVVETVVAAQVGIVTTLSSSVTAPFRAKTCPLTVAPVFKVIDVRAIIEPAKSLVVPSVAELPTCQNTWQACAPFSNTTRLEVAPSREEPAWKMKTEFALPPPSRVSVPVNDKLEADSYTPATSVEPPRSPDTVVKGVRAAASRYAAVKSRSAFNAGPSAVCVTPDDCTPGGKPEMAVPGVSPMSPVMTDAPVLVMALPANTAYVDAVPRSTLTVAALALGTAQKKVATALKLNANAPPSRDRWPRTLCVRFSSVDLCGDCAETP